MSSWAIVDYYLRPKPAYHIIARAMEPVAVGVLRRTKVNLRPNLQHEAFVKSKTKAGAAGVIAHATPHLYEPTGATYSAWAVNATTEPITLKAELRFISVATGQEVVESLQKEVTIKPLGTTEIFAADVPELEPLVLAARLFRQDGTVVAREADWPQPLKHLTFPNRCLEVVEDGDEVTVRTRRPVKGLTFQNGNSQGWSDNCLDVMPGDEQRIRRGDTRQETKWIYYGQKDN